MEVIMTQKRARAEPEVVAEGLAHVLLPVAAIAMTLGDSVA
jgi:hypothetical protein